MGSPVIGSRVGLGGKKKRKEKSPPVPSNIVHFQQPKAYNIFPRSLCVFHRVSYYFIVFACIIQRAFGTHTCVHMFRIARVRYYYYTIRIRVVQVDALRVFSFV